MDRDKQRLQEIETIRDKLMVMLMEMREEKDFEEALNLFFSFSAACLMCAGACLAAGHADEEMIESHAMILLSAFRTADESKESKIILN